MPAIMRWQRLQTFNLVPQPTRGEIADIDSLEEREEKAREIWPPNPLIPILGQILWRNYPLNQSLLITDG